MALQESAPGTVNVAVGIIIIDNYDEAVQPVSEEMRALLTALISRRLTFFALSLGGIIKAFEKDKYLLIISRDKLDEIKNGGFEILKEVREIELGNKMPVTLTIGFGIDGESLSQNLEMARASVDLAMGRGGDQALIKDPERFYFYGGVAREISSNARVRARVKTFAISELITESSGVLVLGHKKADLDCLGAGVGVYKIARALGRECNIVLDEPDSSVSGLYSNLTAEKGYAGVFITGTKALQKLSESSLLVVVDVHRPSLIEARALLDDPRAKKIVVIDHHRRSAEYIDNNVLTYHEPYASSTSELITEMLQYIKPEIKLLPVEADALLAGITIDTKNFTIKTGARTFEAASFLKRSGADSVRVRQLLQSSMESYRARSSTVSSAEIIFGCIAVSVCDANIESPVITAAQAADELLNISGVCASFVFSTDSLGVINLSARSLSGINVQLIAERMGGGGHQTVAGAQFPKSDMATVKQTLHSVIEKYMEENTYESNSN